MALAIASQTERFDRTAFFEELLSVCESVSYREKIEGAATIHSPDQLARLGNGIEALESVPTAIASFALTPDPFEATVSNVIFLGDDTDTLAAMAGALSGAYLGVAELPQRLLELLENSPKGRAYLAELAVKLFVTCQRGREASVSKT